MMMKKYMFLILTALTFLNACKKDQQQDFDFEISGVSNLESKVGETKLLNINVAQTEGVSDNVELTLKNVPKGVTYAFEKKQGTPNYTTTLSIAVTDKVRLGNYEISLEATSKNSEKSASFHLDIHDTLTLSIKVYDATQWRPDNTAGELSDSAIVKLYKDTASFTNNTPTYSTYTDENGIANFYHLPSGDYLFTVEKEGLSNIVNKTTVNGKQMGFVTTSINKYGVLQYHDQNGDGKYNDSDKTQFDILILYDHIPSEKTIWIGK
jgi:hypothetical protein